MATPPADAVALVPAATRACWRATLAGIAARLDPRGYGDAATVAQRLHRVVSRRPRLAFCADLVPVLAECLAAAPAPDRGPGTCGAGQRRARPAPGG